MKIVFIGLAVQVHDRVSAGGLWKSVKLMVRN